MKNGFLSLIAIFLLGCESNPVDYSNNSQPLVKNCAGELAQPKTGGKNISLPTPWCISKAYYPRAAWDNKIEGFVLVKYSIFKNGRVGNVVVLDSVPKGVFDEVAVTSVKNSFYIQGSKDYHDQERRIHFKIPDEYK